MIQFWDIIERAEKGENIDVNAWDRLVGKSAGEVVKKYDLNYDPENPVPADDKLADRMYGKLVGLSVDGLYSHTAWLRTIKEKIEYKGMKDVEVTFPLIEDITMEVAKKYGMIQPGESNTKAVRAVFVIDPKGVIRAIIYYPLSLGRNFDELYRIVVALQTADAFAVATPADWRPGDDVIVPTAGSCGVAKERMSGKQDMTCHDWFFCTRKLDKEEVLSTILKRK